MNKVVSDSGPLINLSMGDVFYLLRFFSKSLLIPPQVFIEVVQEGKNRFGQKETREAINNDWIKIKELKNPDLIQNIIAKEGNQISTTDAAVIALAVQEKTKILLSDDASVRTLALQRGLKIIGSVGILLWAKKHKKIKNVKTFLDRMVKNGFYLDRRIYHQALRAAGEQKDLLF